MRRGGGWTIVIMSSRGGAARRIRLPAWSLIASRAVVLAALSLAVFAGWHLQALIGLHSPRVAQLGSRSKGAMRGGSYTALAPSRPTPTPGERQRRSALDRAARLGLGDRRAASDLVRGLVAPAWRAAADRSGPSDGRLLWPVRGGWFGRGFGSGTGGYHLAVDINAETGSDVLAAGPGVVGYSGRELRGFGNVVMLVHPGGWVTLYAHNQRNLVVPGQRVHQGEVIAALGSTGRSMGPHVHFELMHDGRNCDPMPLIAPGPQSYRNFALPASVATWLPGTSRPGAVRCKPRMPHPGHDVEASGDEVTDAVAVRAAFRAAGP
jgi:murein DD-endopeptidase MepM/ murein hydrolase activator NlpD